MVGALTAVLAGDAEYSGRRMDREEIPATVRFRPEMDRRVPARMFREGSPI